MTPSSVLEEEITSLLETERAEEVALCAESEGSPRQRRKYPLPYEHTLEPSQVATVELSGEWERVTDKAWQTFFFDETESLSPALLANWGRLRFSDLSESTYARLQKIAAMPADWTGTRSEPLDPNSLKIFLEFWSLVKEDAVEPGLTLVPNGHVYAE